MSNVDFKQLQTVLLDAFAADDLRQLLYLDLDIKLDSVVAPGSWQMQTFDILQFARRNGRVAELVAAVARARPLRADVQALAQQYAGKPAVELQTAGAREAEVPIRDAGLEKTLRDELGFIDAAVWSATLGLMQRRVCRVEVNDPDNEMGTGFLVGPDALLTANHVLKAVLAGGHPASAVRFRFDYRSTGGGGVADGVAVELFGADDAARPWLLAQSAASVAGAGSPAAPSGNQLDYVLVKLARPIGSEVAPGTGGPRGWVDLPPNQPPLDNLPMLMILQHPARQPLKLALDTDPKSVLTAGGQRVQYRVNTEPGSSGSPVFDKDWNLLAMHHYGTWTFNQGVPIGLIAATLPAAAIGQPTDRLLKLEAVSASVAAVAAEIKKGGKPTLEVLARITTRESEAVFAKPFDVVLKLDKDIEDAFDGKIDELKGKLKGGLASPDQDDWTVVTDTFQSDVCALLRKVKQLNRGILPKKYVSLWNDNGCA